jgi:hypothetical protein
MPKKRKQSDRIFAAVAATAALILGTVGGASLFKYGIAQRVVSAYGVALCGVSHHVVVVYGDGRQRIVRGRDIATDKEVQEAVERLPDENANAVSLCPKAPPLQVH